MPDQPDPNEYEYVILEEPEVCSICGEETETGYKNAAGELICEECGTNEDVADS